MIINPKFWLTALLFLIGFLFSITGAMERILELGIFYSSSLQFSREFFWNGLFPGLMASALFGYAAHILLVVVRSDDLKPIELLESFIQYMLFVSFSLPFYIVFVQSADILARQLVVVLGGWENIFVDASISINEIIFLISNSSASQASFAFIQSLMTAAGLSGIALTLLIRIIVFSVGHLIFPLVIALYILPEDIPGLSGESLLKFLVVLNYIIVVDLMGFWLIDYFGFITGFLEATAILLLGLWNFSYLKTIIHGSTGRGYSKAKKAAGKGVKKAGKKALKKFI